MMLPREFGALLQQLNAAGIEYVVVGGVAVNLLGYERATGGVGVLVPATREQGAAIQAVLTDLGATRPDGSPLPAHLFDGAHHVRARVPDGTLVDFIPEGEGALSFAAIDGAARPDELHGVPVRRVDLAHLVALKRMADRPRDRDDLDKLAQAYGELPELDP